VLALQLLGEEVVVDARRELSLEREDAVIHALPDVRVERREHFIVRLVQLLRREVVVTVQHDAIEVPLVVRALVENDQRVFFQDASHLVVRASEMLLIVHVACFHGHADRDANWRSQLSDAQRHLLLVRTMIS